MTTIGGLRAEACLPFRIQGHDIFFFFFWGGGGGVTYAN